MSWKIEKFSSLLSESKIPCEKPDSKRRIRVRLNVKGVEKRPDTNDKKGATKQYIRKAGQFIYGKQNFHKGAFGIIPPELDGFETSADIPSFDVREDCLPEWIYYFFKAGNRYLELTKYARGVGSKRIHPKQIADLEIPLPPINIQKQIIEELKIIEKDEISTELTHQLNLVKKLRQSFLREAMQGKLVTQNPNDEPATELLAKIKAEKERLIKEKKILKPKPLPPITKDEIPFEIPENWVWCRLGEIANNIHYGFNASAIPNKDEVRLLRITDIQNNKVEWETVPGCDYSEKDLKSYLLNENDIVIARTGGTIGKSYIVKDINVKSLFASYLIRVIPNSFTNADFLKLFLESPNYWEQLYEAAWGAGQPNVNATKLNSLMLPLPPLPEQKRIVAKLDELMAYCDSLEESIKNSQKQNEMLLGQVLREALEPKEITIKEEVL